MNGFTLSIIFFVICLCMRQFVAATELYPNPCEPDQFYCTNGFCVDQSLVCDGSNRCGDNSDQRSCDGCNAGEFSCGEGTCIAANKVCNDECDCPNCFEEENIYCFNKTSPAPCHMGQFWCTNNICVDSQNVCDGSDSCGDSSDERSCEGCSAGSFSCSSGGGPSCIDPARVCDSVCDCGEGCKDEEECYIEEEEGFSIGAIILILVILVVGACVIIFVLVYVINRYKKKKSEGENEAEAGNMPRMSDLLRDTLKPDLTGNLPMNYNAYNTKLKKTPVFVIETVSLSGDDDDPFGNGEEYNYSYDTLRPDGPVSWFIGTPGISRNSSFHSLHKTFSKYADDEGVNLNAVNNLLRLSSQVDSVSDYSYDMGQEYSQRTDSVSTNSSNDSGSILPSKFHRPSVGSANSLTVPSPNHRGGFVNPAFAGDNARKLKAPQLKISSVEVNGENIPTLKVETISVTIGDDSNENDHDNVALQIDDSEQNQVPTLQVNNDSDSNRRAPTVQIGNDEKEYNLSSEPPLKKSGSFFQLDSDEDDDDEYASARQFYLDAISHHSDDDISAANPSFSTSLSVPNKPLTRVSRSGNLSSHSIASNSANSQTDSSLISSSNLGVPTLGRSLSRTSKSSNLSMLAMDKIDNGTEEHSEL